MIRLSICLLALPFIMTTVSCKKKKETVTITQPLIDSAIVYEDYTVLKPGNYWIYQQYKLDSVNGYAQAQGIYDSSFVEKDTIINAKIYHKYCGVRLPAGLDIVVQYLRDSLSYTVNKAGAISFSSLDFRTVFRVAMIPPNPSSPDTLFLTEQMGFKDTVTVVDAGTFTTATFRRMYEFPDSYPYGRIREYDFRYAKGIGMVSGTTSFFYSSPVVYEKRLVRYHVQ